MSSSSEKSRRRAPRETPGHRHDMLLVADSAADQASVHESDVFIPNCHGPTLRNRDRAPRARSCFTGREPDPALGYTVLFGIKVFLPVEKHMNAACKFRRIEELACRICAKPVGRCWVCHVAPQSDGGYLFPVGTREAFALLQASHGLTKCLFLPFQRKRLHRPRHSQP